MGGWWRSEDKKRKRASLCHCLLYSSGRGGWPPVSGRADALGLEHGDPPRLCWFVPLTSLGVIARFVAMTWMNA